MAALDFTREYVRGTAFALRCMGGIVPQWLGIGV
jgi:hypothetical protein